MILGGGDSFFSREKNGDEHDTKQKKKRLENLEVLVDRGET